MVRLWFGYSPRQHISLLSDALQANDPLLTSLNLQGNRLTATDARELFQALPLSSTLTELKLYDNELSDAGATELAKALMVNTGALLTLDLARNQIGDTGVIELAKALAVNTCLTRLYLYDKDIGDAGTLALGKTLQTRPHPAAEFKLVGVSLRDCWEGLELPRAGRDWNNQEVLVYLDQNSPKIRRRIAFAMVWHARLGQESRWTALDPNLFISMILSLLDREAEKDEYVGDP